MGPIARIRRGFNSSCIATGLERAECSVDMAGSPEPRLVVDLDLPGSPLDAQAVRCDYLVFAGDGKASLVVAPVEFKTKWRVKVVEQLQAGADESARHAPMSAVTFRPVVALERFSPKTVRRRLREEVAFRGQSEPIRLVRCGEKLARVLET